MFMKTLILFVLLTNATIWAQLSINSSGQATFGGNTTIN